jgi:serine/threonine-protein kinase mTOR
MLFPFAQDFTHSYLIPAEEASRLYYTDHNINAMLETLEPLHQLLEKGPETQREHAFAQTHGRDLQAARQSCARYRAHGEVNDLNQAWDLYYNVSSFYVELMSRS